MKKKILSFILAIATLASLMVVPASSASADHECCVSGEATVTKAHSIGTTYDSYYTLSDARRHRLTIYADNSDFPIKIKYYPYSCVASTTKITSYGTHTIRWYSCRYQTYFVITVKRPSEAPRQPSQFELDRIAAQAAEKERREKEQALEEKCKTLIRTLDLPCYYYTVDSCVYTREIKAFMSGEWDGTCISEDDMSGYFISRYVDRRTYHWIGSELWTGKHYNLQANVDYDGYKEIIPGNIPAQKYSLAVSRINGEIEKWSLYDKQDAWKISQVANSQETIKSIIPIAKDGDEKDVMQVFVATTDADGQQHFYSLMSGGEVIRTV